MAIKTFAWVGLAAALLAGAGCTTADTLSSVDTGNKTLFGTDVAHRDLAEGQKNFAAANYGLAEKNFRKAVELNAANGEAWLGLAASYDQLGRFDFADRAYEQLIKVSGRKAEVISNQGYSYLLRGDFKRARELLNEADKMMPDNKRIAANLELLDKLEG